MIRAYSQCPSDAADQRDDADDGQRAAEHPPGDRRVDAPGGRVDLADLGEPARLLGRLGLRLRGGLRCLRGRPVLACHAAQDRCSGTPVVRPGLPERRVRRRRAGPAGCWPPAGRGTAGPGGPAPPGSPAPRRPIAWAQSRPARYDERTSGPAITPAKPSASASSRQLDELLGLDPAVDRVVPRAGPQVLGDGQQVGARVVQVAQRGTDLLAGLAHAEDQVGLGDQPGRPALAMQRRGLELPEGLARLGRRLPRPAGSQQPARQRASS